MTDNSLVFKSKCCSDQVKINKVYYESVVNKYESCGAKLDPIFKLVLAVSLNTVNYNSKSGSIPQVIENNTFEAKSSVDNDIKIESNQTRK
jgi:hypothetical protein